MTPVAEVENAAVHTSTSALVCTIQTDQGWSFAQHPWVTDAGEGCSLLQLLQGSGNGRTLLLPPGVTWDMAICI